MSIELLLKMIFLARYCIILRKNFEKSFLSDDEIISWTSGRAYFGSSFSLKERSRPRCSMPTPYFNWGYCFAVT